MERSESPEMCLVYSTNESPAIAVENAHLISELLPAPGDHDDHHEDLIVNTFVIHTV